MQGFLQTYRKGVWRALPTKRQRALARYTLVMPKLQAFSGALLVPAPIAAILLHLPDILAWLTFLPLFIGAFTLVVDAVGLQQFAAMFGLRSRARDYAKLPLMFAYQVILSLAALKAMHRELIGQNDWYKTQHVGAHHGLAVPAAEASR
jgi:glycosyltransferase XagB